MNLIMRSSLQYIIKNCQRQKQLTSVFNNTALFRHTTFINSTLYSFSTEKKQQSNRTVDEKKQKNEHNKQKKENGSDIEQKDQNELGQTIEDGKKYQAISRNYNQQKVPGLQSRKYSNLSQLQQDIIQSNTFDIENPQIIPKTGASSSYIGIKNDVTQISLGGVKVKGNNEAFLSQIDPQNIPADLNIRFDSQKQLKIVGTESSKQKPQKNASLIKIHNADSAGNAGQTQMKIQPETIQQKTISEHMQEQFGIGIKSYGYSNVKKFRRWDIFLSLLAFAFLIPITSTIGQLHQCYTTTKAIEQERMKEITQLKQRSYQRALLQNKDFRFVN